MLKPWSAGSSHDLVRPHHFVGFMFEDVAVPDVSSGIRLEGNDDASGSSGRTLHHVFPAHFVRLGRHGWAGVAEGQRVAGEIVLDAEAASIEDLEADHVQVDGVGVMGEVGEAPDFGGSAFYDFSDWV